MSATQQHEAALLRCQMDSLRTAADIQIAAAHKERDAALVAAERNWKNFHRCLRVAAAGWTLFFILAVTCALHYGVYHSLSTQGAAARSRVAPSFSEVTK